MVVEGFANGRERLCEWSRKALRMVAKGFANGRMKLFRGEEGVARNGRFRMMIQE